MAAGCALLVAAGAGLWLLFRGEMSSRLIRSNLGGIAIGLAIYGLLNGTGALLMRQFRARLYCLLIAGIAGLFLPAVTFR